MFFQQTINDIAQKRARAVLDRLLKRVYWRVAHSPDCTAETSVALRAQYLEVFGSEMPKTIEGIDQ